MATTFTKLLIHLIFSTKNRLPLITPHIESDLYSYIGGIIRSERGTAIEVGGVKDHVHLLLRLPADASVAELVHRIKGGSGRWANRRLCPAGRFAWQSGYSAFSVSESRVPGVRQYIQRQKEHHRRVSFREELTGILNEHGLAFDERYLLG